MRHTLKISVSKEPASGGIVSCRSVSVRERFLRFLFGEKRRLTIIVPGDSVRELAVSEVMEGGNVHGKASLARREGHLPLLLQKRKSGTASGRPGQMPSRRKARSRCWRTQRNVRMKIRDIPCLMNPEKRCTPGRQRLCRIWCGYPSPT